MNSLEIERRAHEVLKRVAVQSTSWCVITGAPGAGKTTLLELLSAQGYRTSHDVARKYIQSLIDAGIDKYSVRSNQKALQIEILHRMLVLESSLPANELIFLDYALPDNIAFWQMEGLGLEPEVIRASQLFRYRKVFLLEPVSAKSDSVRTEDFAYQVEITEKLRAVYESLEYEVRWVPAVSLSERCSQVLCKLGIK